MDRAPRYGASTAMGSSHSVNQDQWLAEPAQRLFAVADGISSTFAGEQAARLAAKSLPVLLTRALGTIPGPLDEAATHRFHEAFQTLNAKLRAYGTRHPERRGLGTTLVVLLVGGPVALVGHAGDSRCYVRRGSQLTQLTLDHTLARFLVDLGEIDPAVVDTHPTRSQLSRFIGMDGDLSADVSRFFVQPGDRFLLCTDGLSGAFNEAELATILTQHDDAAETAQALVSEAERRPGHDDITALVVDI
jgi:serine/threonine protein phosphatase PrpC